MESNRKQWAVKAAGMGALALLLAVPSFGQSRDGRDARRDDRGRTEAGQRDRSRTDSRGYRDNERVSVQGNIRSFARERDGYRVQLDRGRESFWVPQSYFRNRARDLRVGLAISLGGIFRGGAIYVDAVSWPEDRGYRRGETRDGYLSGIVQRVDYRGGTAEVRDDRNGCLVRVDFRGDRRSRLSLEDVRRGDAIEVSGVWSGGVFAAYDIEAIRDR